MSNHLGERAIVIGGSMAGLMAARVLADYFENVTILERDHIEDHPSVHKSIPQGNQLHALLAGGHQALARLYPQFTETLLDSGAVPVRIGKQTAIFTPEGKTYSDFWDHRRSRVISASTCTTRAAHYWNILFVD